NETGEAGLIRLELKQFEGRDGIRTVIQIEDNGTGLPEADMARLTEPYVTTRDRGTGLGLAIVKKIMEDHGGDLLLENKNEGGARVVLTFPPVEAQTQGSPIETDTESQASE
ncbi:ATP-binding protein, partial [Pseudomonadota bacterium]